jgi:fucose permease
LLLFDVIIILHSGKIARGIHLVFLLVIIYVCFVSLGLPDSVLGSAWPAMQESLGAGLQLAGYLSMIITASKVVSSLCSVRLVSRFGTGRVTAFSILMMAAALGGFCFSPGIAFLFLWAIPLGFGSGCLDAALNNFVALHYSARYVNWLHCFWGIGASVGPMIMSAALRTGYSWRAGYGIISALQTALCVVLFLTLSRWRHTSIDENIQNNTSDKHNSKALLKMPALLPVLGGFVLYSAVEATCGLWGATFIHNRFEVSAADAAMASTLYFSAITLGRLGSGFAAKYLSDADMIRAGQLLALIGVILLLLPSKALAIAGLMIMGLGLAPIIPSMIHSTPQKFGLELSQTAIGLEMAFAYVGSTCFPPLFGILANRWGVDFYPWYLLTCLLVMFVCTEQAGIRTEKNLNLSFDDQVR